MKKPAQCLVSVLFLVSMSGNSASMQDSHEQASAGILDHHEKALLILHLGLAHPMSGALLSAPGVDPSATVASPR